MKNTKNTKADKNLPGTYKLIVNHHDGRGGYDKYVTKPLTITLPNTDETLIRKFVKAGLYHPKDTFVTIKRVK